MGWGLQDLFSFKTVSLQDVFLLYHKTLTVFLLCHETLAVLLLYHEAFKQMTSNKTTQNEVSTHKGR